MTVRVAFGGRGNYIGAVLGAIAFAALAAASRVYCLQEGRVALSGAAKDLTREAIAAAYFGV